MATSSPPTEAAEALSPTVSQRDQWIVESHVFQIYQLFASIPPNAQSLM
ncbi:farnesyltransferase subunit beta-like protein [Trifolium pratense]|uniref:Farnesyltransferase subunit beta-like protein n=2 Tax=Trifolium pratense TaxID=57577 RepID=A0A2K3L0S0_TRIPR|nr:farnesyltransferase subunit beta-like protein [Trifolium pratense]